MRAGVEQGAGRFTRPRTMSADGVRQSHKLQRTVGNATSLEGTSDAMNTAALFQEYFWGQPVAKPAPIFVGQAIKRAANW